MGTRLLTTYAQEEKSNDIDEDVVIDDKLTDATDLPGPASPGSQSGASYPSYGDASFDMSVSDIMPDPLAAPADVSIVASDHSAGMSFLKPTIMNNAYIHV